MAWQPTPTRIVKPNALACDALRALHAMAATHVANGNAEQAHAVESPPGSLKGRAASGLWTRKARKAKRKSACDVEKSIICSSGGRELTTTEWTTFSRWETADGRQGVRGGRREAGGERREARGGKRAWSCPWLRSVHNTPQLRREKYKAAASGMPRTLH